MMFRNTTLFIILMSSFLPIRSMENLGTINNNNSAPVEEDDMFQMGEQHQYNKRLDRLKLYHSQHLHEVSDYDKLMILGTIQYGDVETFLVYQFDKDQLHMNDWAKQHFPDEYHKFKDVKVNSVELYNAITRFPKAFSPEFSKAYVLQWQKLLVSKIKKGRSYKNQLLERYSWARNEALEKQAPLVYMDPSIDILSFEEYYA